MIAAERQRLGKRLILAALVASSCSAGDLPKDVDGSGGRATAGSGGSSGSGSSRGTSSGGTSGMTGAVGGQGAADVLACGADSGTGGFVSRMGGDSAPTYDGLATAPMPPPPISGGTLLVMRDGVTAVAADPDRDVVYVVDLTDAMNPRLRWTVRLTPGDQPGRLAEDAAGQIHVVLRNVGALATVDPVAGALVLRRPVCQLPRGVAYDAATDRLHVACAGGELVSFAPKTAAPLRTVRLPQDLRDVVVDGTGLMVTRFRSSQVLVVDADGAVVEQIAPPTFSSEAVRKGTPFEPAVAWRAVPMPGGGAAMVHQRGMKGTIDRKGGGYGGPSCDTVVHSAVTVMKSGTSVSAGAAIPGFVLPVDMALSPDGTTVALVAAGNGHSPISASGQKLFVTKLDDVASPGTRGCSNDGHHGPATCVAPPTAPRMGSGSGGQGGTLGQGDHRVGSGGMGGTGGSGGAVTAGMAGRSGGGATGTMVPTCRDLPRGAEPVAVAFAGAETVLVQTREPAQLWVVKQPADAATASTTPLPDPFALTLSEQSRGDLGHAIFHANSGAGLACASCHPEGHEDGRLWNFQCEGDRRTQDISGGLSGTEPFHWGGDMKDFPTLVSAVFTGRMSGPFLSTDQVNATLSWINSIPARPPAISPDDPRVTRGRALFQDPVVACATCHAGDLLTNNATVAVGTANGPFQVPSLRGVAWRAPYMHNGCASDLASRFSDTTCGGGDSHGVTSHLTADQLADLVAFLESL